MNRGKRGGAGVTREELRDEVAAWAERIGVLPKRIQVQPLRRKWASCSPEGRLTFATDLLAESVRFREEVIVHELLHLVVPNHGRLFRSLLRSHLGRTAQELQKTSCTTSE